jgi:hypothetical protein
MSFTSSSHGNTKTNEIKPHILHNRMPQEMHLAGCTQPSTIMTEEEPHSQLLGYPVNRYRHLYPYGIGYPGVEYPGLYGLGYGLGYGYGLGGVAPSCYMRGCGYRGGYPWRHF